MKNLLLLLFCAIGLNSFAQVGNIDLTGRSTTSNVNVKVEHSKSSKEHLYDAINSVKSTPAYKFPKTDYSGLRKARGRYEQKFQSGSFAYEKSLVVKPSGFKDYNNTESIVSLSNEKVNIVMGDEFIVLDIVASAMKQADDNNYALIRIIKAKDAKNQIATLHLSDKRFKYKSPTLELELYN